MEDSGERFYEVEQRLNVVNQLKGKYGDSIESVLAYKEECNEKIEKYNKNWVFEYTPMSVWHYTVIRNFKKFYGKEEYQTETIDPNTGVGYDDADFCYDLHMKGYKIWKCVNAVQSYAQNWIHLKNSVVYTDTTNPWIRLKNKKATETKWLLNDEGEVDEQAFVKRTRRKDFALMIPRHKKVNVINEFTKSYKQAKKERTQWQPSKLIQASS